MPEPSILDERLAEIDRRLRMIQSGLEPVPDPPVRGPGPELEPAFGPELDPVAQALEEPPLDPRLPPAVPPPPLRAAPEPAVEDDPLDDDPPDEAPLLPPAAGAPAGARAGDTGALLAQLRALGEAHERLLELHRELLSQYAELLEHRASEAPSEPVASVIAGPFSSAAAVHAFERTLSSLPGVAEVMVREYVGADRVALDVRLATG